MLLVGSAADLKLARDGLEPDGWAFPIGGRLDEGRYALVGHLGKHERGRPFGSRTAVLALAEVNRHRMSGKRVVTAWAETGSTKLTAEGVKRRLRRLRQIERVAALLSRPATVCLP